MRKGIAVSTYIDPYQIKPVGEPGDFSVGVDQLRGPGKTLL